MIVAPAYLINYHLVYIQKGNLIILSSAADDHVKLERN